MGYSSQSSLQFSKHSVQWTLRATVETGLILYGSVEELAFVGQALARFRQPIEIFLPSILKLDPNTSSGASSVPSS